MICDNLPRFKGRGALFAGLVAALLAEGPAAAVVGPSDSGARFADRLVMVVSRRGDEQANCTGVVLKPQVVLTAAHCLRSARDTAIFYRDGEDRPVFKPVQAIAIHPDYHADAIAKRVVSIDLALVETETPLDPRFAAPPLADGDGPAVGDETILAGFGDGREGAPTTAGVLRSARLKVRAPRSTILLWAEDGNRAGAGACVGDSGGPLFLADGETVAAIVAWTSGPERGKHCGSLTQGPLIAPQREWIDATLAGWGR